MRTHAIVRGTASLASRAVGADLVHAAGVSGYDGQGVTVAVVDSGSHRRHEDYCVAYDTPWSEYFETMSRVDAVE